MSELHGNDKIIRHHQYLSQVCKMIYEEGFENGNRD